MEVIVTILALTIFICSCAYGLLTYRVWQTKSHDLKRLQKLLILDGWWIFNSSYVSDENKNLIVKGRILFSIVLISVITLMVVVSSSNKI